MKRFLALILSLIFILTVAGCGAGGQAPAPSSSEESSVPENPSLSEEPGPEPMPESIYLQKRWPSGELIWELEVTDEEEMKLLQELLSVDDLTQFASDFSMWPDGAIPIGYRIHYADKEVDGACSPDVIGEYQDAYGWTYTIITVNDWTSPIFYQYPSEQGDALLAFLESKGIAVE